ncbi:MAG: hypothetical protein R2939_16400 [Kofleriaceae bacterium]
MSRPAPTARGVRVRGVLAAVLASTALGCVGIDSPVVVGVEPAAAARGAVVTVRGTSLCGAGADDEAPCAVAAGDVTFGLDPPAGATVVSWADEQIEVVVPSSAVLGEVAVVVTVGGRSSNAATFTVLP